MAGGVLIASGRCLAANPCCTGDLIVGHALSLARHTRPTSATALVIVGRSAVAGMWIDC